ncbi:alpha/beta-hydrolase [Athelia psychrophila]|uniref:sn-1-specific diacylglycerol lipase n=1 Tax=Athelia psychrophila TaxID=1759441 RepID=A0A166K940_9AGAM|nr:alpha/beta-hydrolase [Fibularhizoctonia sp. CBS 109695]
MTTTTGINASSWDKYGRWGIDIASATSAFGFRVAKTSTRLGFSITRGVASAVVGVASPVVDHAFFGGSDVSSMLIGGAVGAAITFAEQLTLAPIHLGEYITSGSLLAAHSSINVLSVFFPGSSEASFSLASFITLIKREWNEPDSAGHLPSQKLGITEVARGLIAWVALQGVTQEWQEEIWLKSLKEIRVEEQPPPFGRPRRDSRVRVTSDVIFPGNRGQLISADIGEATSRATGIVTTGNSPVSPTPRTRIQAATPKSTKELKAELRRLSKIILAGYGGASLVFFGVKEFASYPTPTDGKRSEEAQLASAIGASEAEASGSRSKAATATADSATYSWWDMILGKHDQEIFERYANLPSDQQHPHSQRAKEAKETWRRKKAAMRSEAVVGVEHQMPRFWVLTDHSRGQIVLVLRGTMSLNELAVDLTCESVDFEPAQADPLGTTTTTSDRTEEAGEEQSERRKRAHSWTASAFQSSLKRLSRSSLVPPAPPPPPRHQAHSGMLKMARIMGEEGKPVHRAIRQALRNNSDYELVLCGHSLGAGVASLLGLVSPLSPRFDWRMRCTDPWMTLMQMWADPTTCRTVRASGLPPGRKVSVYCLAPPCLVDPALGALASNMITSLVYSHDVVSRLSLGSIRDIRNASMWLCAANGEEGAGGSASITQKASAWKAGRGDDGDPEMFIATRKTLEANMQSTELYPPGRVLWALRDTDLHVSHRVSGARTPPPGGNNGKDKLRLFEVLDVQKVFSQIVFSRDMLSSHLPHQYDRVLHDLL